MPWEVGFDVAARKKIWETHCRATGWERPLKCKQDKEVQSKYTVRDTVNESD